jgi:type II secretory pathway pseudopilin PulG
MKHRPVIPIRRANQAGVTLVELIVFIVVVALLATGLIAVFTSSMKATPPAGDVSQALQLAQERMELILAYKKSKGFAAVIDPCTLASPPMQCTSPAGFGVTTPATIINNWNGSNEFKEIRVDVAGPQSLTIRLTAIVASY